MITGELRNKVDSIWDTIWTGGITSPITTLEQITYLMFMKLLDDNQLKKEANANALGVTLKNKVFGDGECVISEEPRIVTDYKNLRWSVFHNFEPNEMFTTVQQYVFPFIKSINTGKDTAFSRYMKDTVFLSMIIRPTGQMLPYFLQSVLSSPSMKLLIEERAVGVTMANLNVPIVSNLPIPMYPMEKQRAYISILEQTDKSKFRIKQSLEKLEKCYKALLQKYFG